MCVCCVYLWHSSALERLLSHSEWPPDAVSCWPLSESKCSEYLTLTVYDTLDKPL